MRGCTAEPRPAGEGDMGMGYTTVERRVFSPPWDTPMTHLPPTPYPLPFPRLSQFVTSTRDHSYGPAQQNAVVTNSYSLSCNLLYCLGSTSRLDIRLFAVVHEFVWCKAKEKNRFCHQIFKGKKKYFLNPHIFWMLYWASIIAELIHKSCNSHPISWLLSPPPMWSEFSKKL